jgi:hypothetical protein
VSEPVAVVAGSARVSERVAGWLDGARRPLLRRLLRVAVARWIFVDRGRRVVAGSLLAVATAFAMAAWQPLVALWLGAALFGVPHVVSGVRFAAVQQRLAWPTRALVAVALAVGVVELAGSGTRIADGAVRAYVLLFAAAILVELAGARAWRSLPRLVAAVVVLAAAAAGLIAPRLTLVALAHLHGLGAVAWFARRARARGVPAWPFVAAVATVMVAAAGGAFDSLWATVLWAPRSAAASIVAEAAGSAVDGAGAIVLRRALFLYAFGQALHFAIWLRLVPEVERAAKVPSSFRRALALFEADFGRWARPLAVACIVAAPLLLLGGGVAREAYFALTYFHVGLEAAALARAHSARSPRPTLPQRQACSLGARAAMLPATEPGRM